MESSDVIQNKSQSEGSRDKSAAPPLASRVSFSKLTHTNTNAFEEAANLSTKSSFSVGKALPSVASPHLIRTRSLTLSAGIPYVSSNPTANVNILSISAVGNNNDANSSGGNTARGYSIEDHPTRRSVVHLNRDDLLNTSEGSPRRYSSNAVLTGTSPRTYTYNAFGAPNSGYHTSRTMETLRMDLEDRCRIFRKTTAVQFKLKHELHPRPRYAFSGDPDRIADAVKNCLVVIRDSRIVALAHMRKLFQSVAVLKRWMKRWNEHRVARISKILDYWEEEEKVRRRSLELEMATAFYRTHHTIQDTIDDQASVNVPAEIKMSAAMLIVRRNDLHYVNKRTAWAKKVGAVKDRLTEAKVIFQLSLRQRITLDNKEEEREVVVNTLAEMLDDGPTAVAVGTGTPAPAPQAPEGARPKRGSSPPQQGVSPTISMKIRRTSSKGPMTGSASPDSASLSPAANSLETSVNSVSLSPKKRFPAPTIAMHKVKQLRREYMDIALQSPIPNDATLVTFEQVLKIRDEIVNQRIHVASKITLNAYAASREERDKQRAAIYAAAEKKRIQEYKQRKRLQAEQEAEAAANSPSPKSRGGRGRGRISASVESLLGNTTTSSTGLPPSPSGNHANQYSSEDEACTSLKGAELASTAAATTDASSQAINHRTPSTFPPTMSNAANALPQAGGVSPPTTRNSSASPNRGQLLPSHRSSASSGRRGTLTQVSLSSTVGGLASTNGANAAAEQLAVSLARTVSLTNYSYTTLDEEGNPPPPEFDFRKRRKSSVAQLVDTSSEAGTTPPIVTPTTTPPLRAASLNRPQSSDSGGAKGGAISWSTGIHLANTVDVLGVSDKQERLQLRPAKGMAKSTTPVTSGSLLPPKPLPQHATTTAALTPTKVREGPSNTVDQAALPVGLPPPVHTSTFQSNSAVQSFAQQSGYSTLASHVQVPTTSNIRIRLPNNSLLHYESMLTFVVDTSVAAKDSYPGSGGSPSSYRATSAGRQRSSSIGSESASVVAANGHLRQSDLSVQLRPRSSMSMLAAGGSPLGTVESRRASFSSSPMGKQPMSMPCAFGMGSSRPPLPTEAEVAQQKARRTLSDYDEGEYTVGMRHNGVPAMWSGKSPSRSERPSSSSGAQIASPSSPFLYNHKRQPTHPENNQLLFTSPLRPVCKLSDPVLSQPPRLGSASGARSHSLSSVDAPPLGFLAKQPCSSVSQRMLNGGELTNLRNATYIPADDKLTTATTPTKRPDPSASAVISSSVLLRAASVSALTTPNNSMSRNGQVRLPPSGDGSPTVVITRKSLANEMPPNALLGSATSIPMSSMSAMQRASVSTNAYASATVLPMAIYPSPNKAAPVAAPQTPLVEGTIGQPCAKPARQFGASFLNRDKNEALRQATGFAYNRSGMAPLRGVVSDK